MGYMCHHAIVVTASDDDLIAAAHAKAINLGMSVSPITNVVTNGYRSFLVAPDGSNEGWGTSDCGDGQRDAFVSYLRDLAWEDGSSRLGWVEVQFEDDYDDTAIVRGYRARLGRVQT